MDYEIPKQDGAHGDGAVRSMKCSASGPRYCAVCGEWPAMETPNGLRCHLCECRDYAAAHPVPLPENPEILRDLASIGVSGAGAKLSRMPKRLELETSDDGVLASSNCSAASRALKLIASSAMIDFGTSLDWAQWCRAIARAGLEEDEEVLESCEREVRERQNADMSRRAR